MKSVLHAGRTAALVSLIIQLFAVLAPLPAAGQGESLLSQARQLVLEKRYNEALLMLAEAARKDPENAEEAEALIRQIRTIRGDYNQKYEKLISVLYEQKDVEAALKLIRELEGLDSSPNLSTVNAVEKAKDSALFVFNQKRFNDIMSAAEGLLARKEYEKAVETYLGGFDLGKEFFVKAGYGNIVESAVYGSLERVSAAAGLFMGAREGFVLSAERLLAALGSAEPAAILAARAAFARELDNAGTLLRTSLAVSAQLDQQSARLSAVKEGAREDLFIGFTQRLTMGRKAQKNQEGIRGAALQAVLDRAGQFKEASGRRVEQAFSAALERWSREEWQAAGAAFAEFEPLGMALAAVLADFQQAVPVGPGLALGEEGWRLVTALLDRLRSIQVRLAAGRFYQEQARLVLELDRNRDLAALNRAGLEALRVDITAWTGRLRQLDGDWRAAGGAYGAPTKWAGRGDAELVGLVGRDIAGMTDRFVKREIAAANRMAELDYAPLEADLAFITGEFNEAEKLFQGIQRELAVGDQRETFLSRFPAEAERALAEVILKIDDLSNRTSGFIRLYRAERPYVAADQAIRSRLDGAGAIVSRLAELKGGSQRVAAEARDLALAAERFRNDGNRRLVEAEAALRQNRFEQARQGLAAARERYLQALINQENAAFRKDSDDRLAKLGKDIVDSEKSLVVRQVRDMINQAKDHYNKNLFDRAVDVLDQAQVRHRIVFPDDNPEIVYWRGFAKAAMDARSGREVVRTDALYSEIRQALSQARQNYELGRDLVGKGDTSDGLKALKKSEDILNYVKQMSPLNQERSVLALRIEQVRDPNLFVSSFRRMFQDARGKLAGKPQEAYSDLKDLEQIDPAFPGIKDAIYNAEIALRIRIPPPDPRALAQSDQLYQQAFRIVSTNIRAQFPIALEQLNKALEFNPNNQRAVELKDRIQADAGGQTAVVLSSGAEQQYRIAEQRFIDGKFLEALAIVERLLQNKESKNYPPLQELKRRIESRI